MSGWPPPPAGPDGHCASPGTWATGRCSALILRMHGNELRKAGHPAAGIIRLRQALQIDDHPVRQGAGLVLLARAAAESGQADLFDATTSQCVQAIETASEQDVLFSPFTVREVRLRGLLATGRTAQAAELAGRYPADSGPPSPHWRVIERITTAEVLARSGDEHAAADHADRCHQRRRNPPPAPPGPADHPAGQRSPVSWPGRRSTSRRGQPSPAWTTNLQARPHIRALRESASVKHDAGPSGFSGWGRVAEVAVAGVAGADRQGRVRAALVRAAAGGARRGSRAGPARRQCPAGTGRISARTAR